MKWLIIFWMGLFGPVVSYRDAAAYAEKKVTVVTPVRYAFYEAGKEMFFGSRTAPHHAHMVPDGGDKSGFFTFRILKEDFFRFPRDFTEKLKNKEVLVSGEMSWFQGDPHIIVTRPEQIRIIGSLSIPSKGE